MYVCSCRAITDTQVQAAVLAGAGTVSDLIRACGAGGGCGGCHELLARLLADASPVRSCGEGTVQPV